MNTAYSISGTLIVHEQHNFIMYYVKHDIFNKGEKNLELKFLFSSCCSTYVTHIRTTAYHEAPLGTTTHFSIDMNPQLQCTVQQTQQDQNRI